MAEVADVRGVVLDECRAVAASLAGLDEAAFAVVTNCPPWTLKDLLVHIWQTLQLPRAFTPAAEPMAAAADWYRRSERETPEYRERNADRARDAAAIFSSGADAVTALVDAGERLEARIADADLGAAIVTPGLPSISLGGYIVTRVISVAVHGIDVAISRGAPTFTTPAASDLTAGIVEELLGVDRASLGWSPEQTILWGTGRGPAPEGRVPDDVRRRLPVIS